MIDINQIEFKGENLSQPEWFIVYLNIKVEWGW